MTDLLSIPEAATLAGVSERTMRRWASSGHVRTVPSGQGRRVVATSLPESPATNGQRPDADRPATATGPAMTGEAASLAGLVRELSDRLAEQTAMTALWMERARVLSDQLALAAPQQPVEASTEPAAPDPVTGAPSSRWRPVDAWITPGVAVVVLAIVLAVLTLAALPAWHQ